MTERKFDVLKMSGTPSKADADRQRTDRKLLELAAKAAGIEVYRGIRHQSEMLFRSVRSVDGRFSGIEWNPLEDDGDALRLATLCLMDVEIGVVGVTVSAPMMMPFVTVTETFEDGDQRLPMTRRAIVRVAAAMAEGGEHG